MPKSKINFNKIHVTFNSIGTNCRGYLYLPDNDKTKVPCLIMANGFSGTMDWNLPRYAEKFVAIGIAVLIFDYRYFGESGGEPRQFISVKSQRDDIRNAIMFAKNYKGINSTKIALWGTSLGGGHVINVAADDPTIAAVIAQVPGVDMVNPKAKATIKIPLIVLIKILTSAVRDGIQGLLKLPPYYIKIFGRPGETAVFTDPKLRPRFEALMKSNSTWENKFTPRFYLAPPRYKRGTAEKIKAPLLVCVADKEVYGNPRFQEWVGRQAPKGEVKHYLAEHFDFYHGEIFEKAVKDQIAFLRDKLL